MISCQLLGKSRILLTIELSRSTLKIKKSIVNTVVCPNSDQDHILIKLVFISVNFVNFKDFSHFFYNNLKIYVEKKYRKKI